MTNSMHIILAIAVGGGCGWGSIRVFFQPGWSVSVFSSEGENSGSGLFWGLKSRGGTLSRKIS